MWGWIEPVSMRERNLICQALHAQALDAVECLPQRLGCGFRGIESPISRGWIAPMLVVAEVNRE